MPILITGLFAPSGGAGSFDLYAPEDIQAGSVNVVLQAIAGGSFKAGSHATAPVGEIVAQVKTTTGAPSHSASLGTLCWNSIDLILYINNNGTTGWTAVGGTGHDAVTLAADAQILLNLVTQEIGLVAQNANKVLVGPAAGVDADPTFRALVDADIPAAIARDAEVATAVSDHAGAPDPHTVYQKESEKDVASGYAGLTVGGKIAASQIQEVLAYADLTDDPYADHNARHEPGGADPMAVDAAAATGSLRTIGTTATAACAGNDARLSDARTPTVHDLAGALHSADTLANLNSKISDADIIPNTLFDAQTILAATVDNTPAAVTVAEQRIIGRKTGGNIAALTAAEVVALLVGTPADYTVTNAAVDRAFNADATTLDEIADILGTLIADLTALGILQ